LRASALGCYGNLWTETPALDAFASEGVVFDRHFADATDGAGARRAWRTGRYHLPHPDEKALAEPAGDDLLAELRSGGVITCLILDESRPVRPDFEIGWDQVVRVVPTEDETPLEATLDSTRSALEELADRDHWLLWIDLATPLPPWKVPEEFQAPYVSGVEGEEADEESEEPEQAEEPLTPVEDVPKGPLDPTDDTLFLRILASYSAAVSYLDAGIGQLLEDLRGLDGEGPVVIVTSDCGQALGDHGYVGPVRADLHEEIVHLPLIVRLPGAVFAGRRVSGLTQAVDLATTVAECFGVRLPSAHGHSLLPFVRGQAEIVRSYACSGRDVGNSTAWALRTADWSFHLSTRGAEAESAPEPRLFVQPDDRWEVNNVLQHHLELAEQLERTLRGFVAATRRPGPLGPPPLPDLDREADPSSPTMGESRS
jgi:arylsulfatase A-like enzyme